MAVPGGVLLAARGGFVVALRRPSGEVVVHRRPWRPSGLSRALSAWPILRGWAAWLEYGGLLARALRLDWVQQGGAGALAPAAVAGSARPRRLTWQGQLAWLGALLAALGGLALVPAGLLCVAALVHVRDDIGLVEAALQVASWALGVLAVALMGGGAPARRWRMHHAAMHQALWAYARGLPLRPAVVAKQPADGGACAGTGLTWFATVLGLFAWACWAPGAAKPAAVAAAALAILGLAWDVGAARPSGAWGWALAWPGRWLRGVTLLAPDGDALEVALIALSRLTFGDADAAPVDGTPSLGPVGLPDLAGLADACARRQAADGRP